MTKSNLRLMFQKQNLFGLVFCFIWFSSCYIKPNSQPNVILIMTDDQGIGDLGCHGNPWLQTPHIDQLYNNSFRFTDFHVSPLCTPTRAAIMTGQYPINNGTWATFKGRASMHHNTPTMAELFQQNGYTTGLFGKWHLGDNYPARPTDCGFDVAVHHGSGGLGEITDYWGNDYFDDMYLVNNQPKRFKGYCTDVWFAEAMSFIKDQNENPFFIYLSTNAPHAPLIVDETYAKPYLDLEGKALLNANFYGMISNIDENMGKLMQFLETEQIADNTILIFMTDNGTQFGYSKDGELGWNKGFRGNKHGKEEGGHRVPFFIRWPTQEIEGGKDIDQLCAHVDLIPTLAKLCDLPLSTTENLDGIDFSELLFDKKATLKDRTYFIHHRQDWKAPFDIDKTCIAKHKWRLLDGKFLYDVQKDPMQLRNASHLYPEIVKELLNENQEFIQQAKQRFEYQNIPPTVIGNPLQDTAWLTIQHAVGEEFPIYSQEQVAKGTKNKNNIHPLKIDRDGTYVISLQRWPNESIAPIQGIPESQLINGFEYNAIQAQRASITIQNQQLEVDIDEKMTAAQFEVSLASGTTTLAANFLEGDETYGAYYVYISKANN